MRYLLISLILIAVELNAQIPNEHELTRPELEQECLNNKIYTKDKFKIDCEENFHLYQAAHDNSKSSQVKTSLRIAEFNALHPGMSKTRFKDFRKIAQLINKFDVMAVTELIPLMADDYENNYKVLEFIREVPTEIRNVEVELGKLFPRNSRLHNQSKNNSTFKT